MEDELQKKIPRRALLFGFFAAALAACAPKPPEIKLPPVRNPETPPPETLFTLSVNGKKVFVVPYVDTKDGYIPPTAGKAYSRNIVHKKLPDVYWVIAHNTTNSGNLIDDSSNPDTKVLINGQLAEFTQSFSVKLGPKLPNGEEPDYISLTQNGDIPADHRFSPQELQELILSHNKPGYTTYILQTCIKQGTNNEWGRVFNIWRIPKP